MGTSVAGSKMGSDVTYGLQGHIPVREDVCIVSHSKLNDP